MDHMIWISAVSFLSLLLSYLLSLDALLYYIVIVSCVTMITNVELAHMLQFICNFFIKNCKTDFYKCVNNHKSRGI